MPEKPRSVTLDEVTEAAMSGVMRALDARRVETGEEFIAFPWPILVGIIFNPAQIGTGPFTTAGEKPAARE
jgi:hypothetical protein